mgnify:CR=1 FL=1
MSRLTYRHTIAASYLGYITQAIVNNLAPLLFVTFMSEFSLTLEQITMMTTVNFAVQLLVDLLSAKLVDRIGYRVSIVAAHVLAVMLVRHGDSAGHSAAHDGADDCSCAVRHRRRDD